MKVDYGKNSRLLHCIRQHERYVSHCEGTDPHLWVHGLVTVLCTLETSNQGQVQMDLCVPTQSFGKHSVLAIVLVSMPMA